VGHVLHERDNLLVVRVDTGIRSAWTKQDNHKYPHISSLKDTGFPRMWVRKAQFTFGWDWAPALLTCGIWRSVELRSYRDIAIRSVYLSYQLENDQARVKVQADLESFASRKLNLHIRVSVKDNETQRRLQELQCTIKPGNNTLDVEILLEKPVLWWPRPLGSPYLYDFTLEVIKGTEILDAYSRKIGLREVELIQEPISAQEGLSFTIRINGKNIFCKGANWVPADSILARVDRGKYRALVDAAAEANFNMFRIWGGGIYEDEFFYELCDEMGIMIWQDFMFACSLYPDDDQAFCSEVRREAEEIIRQLGNHPCLVLWCGNNENDWIYHRRVQAGWDLPVFYGQKLYHRILPDLCTRLDPSRPYWPSSPCGGEEPNSEQEGDRHNWEVYVLPKEASERADFSQWSLDRGKFLSEFGLLSPPGKKSLERFIPTDELTVDSPAWRCHNNQFERGFLAASLRLYWVEPEKLTMDEYLLAAQLVQAEALKYAIEHFRRRKFFCSGVLFWQYSECWGSISLSIIDYYLNLKPGYYYVRRAYAPVLLSFQEEENGYSVWITNDTLKNIAGNVEYGLLDLVTSVWNSDIKAFTAEPNCSQRVVSFNIPSLKNVERGRFLLLGRFSDSEGVLAQNRLFLCGFFFKNLYFPDYTLSHQIEQRQPGQFRLRLKADRFVWAVQIKVSSSVWLEDNYFDLLPGEEKSIVLKGNEEDMNRLTVTGTRVPHPDSGEKR
ncbi:MAG: glycoside hydrolase family 2 protein, partial [Spirochaetota bacterium]